MTTVSVITGGQGSQLEAINETGRGSPEGNQIKINLILNRIIVCLHM